MGTRIAPPFAPWPYIAGSRYVDRGDPAAYDFLTADFPLNAAWGDVDLSAILPAGAVAVNILLAVTSVAAIGSMYLKNGNFIEDVTRPNELALQVQTLNAETFEEGFVSLPSDRKLSYFHVNYGGGETIRAVVKGWYI